ncbi:9520_t:CDS:2 [Diversispora eburnea]|uniref:9520_t:CDS:1 n=1 Tax=Diversispora eburnea TaxID=1213867 RepID=A0A9N8Z1R8_9GLOM|nr:9520_t:CDS:2 [Diversispora eburnea]
MKSGEKWQNWKNIKTTITQNRNNNKEKEVKFWDIPVGMREQEFKHMLNHKFEKVISCTMSTRGMWLSAIAYFDDPNILEQILFEWSQMVGEESCKVSISSMTFTELKNRDAHTVKLINLSSDMLPHELHVIITQMEVKTYYFPRNLYGKKKRMTIITLESEEEKRKLIEQTWKAEEYIIKIVDIKTKTCHRKNIWY